MSGPEARGPEDHEKESGAANMNALRKKGENHPIEQVGAKLRAMMPWLGGGIDKSKR